MAGRTGRPQGRTIFVGFGGTAVRELSTSRHSQPCKHCGWACCGRTWRRSASFGTYLANLGSPESTTALCTELSQVDAEDRTAMPKTRCRHEPFFSTLPSC